MSGAGQDIIRHKRRQARSQTSENVPVQNPFIETMILVLEILFKHSKRAAGHNPPL